MKKVTLFLMLFAAFQATAQEFHLIPKVGLNLANTTGYGADIRPGINVGIGGDIMLNKMFGVETGVYYSMQGDKSKGGEGGDISYTTKLDYMNIPVYVKGYAYKGLYLFAGPQFGFNLSQKNESSSAEIPSFTISMNVIRDFDCSLGVGAGYQFDCGLLASANYNIGLSSIYKKSLMDSISKDSHHSVFQLNIGWVFKL